MFTSQTDIPQSVSDIQPLSTLTGEFAFGKAPASTTERVTALSNCGSIVRVRGDGNCFYRAVMYGFVRVLIDADTGALMRFCGLLEKAAGIVWRPESEDVHFTRVCALTQVLAAEPDVASRHATHVRALRGSDPSLGDGVDMALVMVLRRMVANALHMFADTRQPDGGMTPREIVELIDVQSLGAFVDTVVMCEGACARTVVMSATPQALGVNVGVVYTDYSDDDVSLQHFAAPGGEAVPTVWVMFRPGHYDALVA